MLIVSFFVAALLFKTFHFPQGGYAALPLPLKSASMLLASITYFSILVAGLIYLFPLSASC